MEPSNKKNTINENDTYQYIHGNTHTKMKIFVEFSDSANNKEIAEEVTAILKNNYLKRIQSRSMSKCLEPVQSTRLLKQGKEGAQE